ncbi:glycosyltransferase family 2 protein [Cellulomonas marina]|uniref:Glycosyltransferase, GT2 family n=1 Tax=Cellulomonas marina TaxID=988821 RepID=A0A1I0YE53_9CELL|nr:glycosyltransferase [Cellulomonas marina]GIG28748.1 hypothetical protein Cma02nite_13480 [Cellulomonas marina]SFB11501.1 Glycosyltransferase, GT2 family [Cellulomonas marina]
MLSVAVCVCTKLRPQGLAALLDSLSRQEDPVGPDHEPVDVRVVVVDNDAEPSARAGVEARTGDRWPVVYVHEPVPGIPAARNAAVAAALSQPCDVLLFLDDDERADPAWLRTMLEVRRTTGAEVVTATVEPEFEPGAPAWAVQGGFYERPRFATGTEIGYARTSNVLIDTRLFTQDGLRFEHTGSQGGEDTHFFAQAVARGRRIVWADEAVVRETVPASRISVRWLVARSYRYGLTRSASLRLLGGTPLRYARRVVNGLLTVLRGLVLVVVGRGRIGRTKGLQEVALGAGLVLGLVGATYDDYRTVHGR